MNDVADKVKSDPRNKLMKTLLFFSNWLFLVFLSKRFISPPGDGGDFLLKNITTFFSAVIVTGLMIHFLSRKIIWLLIPGILILAIALAVI
jgi:hypothetical protein